MNIHVSASVGNSQNLTVNLDQSVSVKTGAASLFSSQSLTTVSASYANFATNAATASLLAAGGLIESASYANNAVTASYATTASFATNVLPTDFTTILNTPVGLVSSSLQINSSSFSGSFKGDGSNITGIISSSYATTSSYAATINPLFQPSTASFALTAGTTIGGIAGTGTVGNIAKFIGASTVAVSTISEQPDGTILFSGGNISASGSLSVLSGSLLLHTSNNGSASIFSPGNLYIKETGGFTIFGSWILSALDGGGDIGSNGFNRFNNLWLKGNVNAGGNLKSGFDVLLGPNGAALYGTKTAGGGGTSIHLIEVSNTNRVLIDALGVGVIMPSTLVVTGSITGLSGATFTGPVSASAFSGSHIGDGSNLINLVSSSYAVTASYALNGGSGGASVSSSYALTSSYAVTASYAPNAGPADFNVLLNKPVGLVSSSLQINTGSFTGSFKGDGTNITGIISSSYAVSSSFAATVSPSYFPATASYALSAGATGGGLSGTGTIGTISKWIGVTALGDSIISEQSGNIVKITGSLNILGTATASAYSGDGSRITGVITASYASQADFGNILHVPIGVVSSSIQINTGSFTGSFIGDGAKIINVVSSSYALSASWAPGGAAADFNTLLNKPSGLVSSSVQINSGSFTGSFTGSARLSTIDGITQINPVSEPFSLNGASLQLSAGRLLQFAGLGQISFPSAGVLLLTDNGQTNFSMIRLGGATTAYPAIKRYSASINIRLADDSGNAPLTASAFQGDGTQITGIVSSSYAVTSSYASTTAPISYAALTSIPTGIVSSSLQINTGSFAATGSFTGSFKGDGTNLTGIVSSSYSVTASYSATTAPIAFTKLTGVPNGLVSSSLQINTGSFAATGSFTGSFKGDGANVLNVVSSSYALSASWAPGGAGGSSVSSSYATTSSYASVAQTVLGNVAFATNAVTASYFTGSINFPNGLVVTGSITGSAGLVLSGPNGLVVTGSMTGSAGLILTGPVTASGFNATSPSPQIIHAWGKVIVLPAVSLGQSWGIANVNKIITGIYSVTWSVNFSDSNYCITFSPENITSGSMAVAAVRHMAIESGSQQPNGVTIRCYDDTTTTHVAKDPNAFHIQAYGI